MKKKVLAVLLAVSMTAGLLASCCVKIDETAKGVTATVVSTAKKYMLNQELPSDSPSKLSATLAKNEYEGLQFILKDSVSDFAVKNITVSDLSNGTDTIPGNSVKIYRQHYILANMHYLYAGVIPASGYYPDGLIELKYDQSHHPDGFKVKKGENQGYWLTVYSRPDQQPGIYKGTVTVETDKDKIELPLECEIYDFNISEEVHFKSYYCMIREFPEYYNLDYHKAGYDEQKNAQQAKVTEFYEFLLKYRMSPSRLPVPNYARPEEYYEAAEKYAATGKTTAFFMELMNRRGWRPSTGRPVGQGENNDEYYFFEDFVELTQKLNKIAPGKVYALTHDEPQWNDRNEPDWTEGVEWFTGTAKLDLSPSLKTAITNDAAPPELGEINPNTGKDSGRIRYLPGAWCIKPHSTQRGDAQDFHEHGTELWWYTCNLPVYPALNTHIDSPLIAARTLSWMEYDYDIDGYLCYSAANSGRTTTDSSGATIPGYEDPNPWLNPYSYVYSPESADAPGDGYVMMRGFKGDGIIDEDVPVPTIRLEALRDGMEDYEYLYNYEQKLNGLIKKLGIELDPQTAMGMFYDALYNNTTDYSQDVNKLFFTRDDLARKITEDVDFIYYITRDESNYNNCPVRDIVVYTDGTKPVTINGKTVKGENGKYTLTVQLDETKYRNDFIITVGDKEVQVHVFPDKLNSKLSLFNFSEDVAGIINKASRKDVATVQDQEVTFDPKVSNNAAIPAKCLNVKDINWKDYTHIRFKVSDGTDNGEIKDLVLKLHTNRDAFALPSINITSGSYIDIPLHVIKDINNFYIRPCTKISVFFNSSATNPLTFSDFSLINKEFQPPEYLKWIPND